MRNTKRLLGFLLALALLVNMFSVGVSAVIGDGNELSANVTLVTGRYNTSTKVFTPLAPGETVTQDEIITVRVIPQTDFLVGASSYPIMFDKTLFTLMGTTPTNTFTFNTNKDNLELDDNTFEYSPNESYNGNLYYDLACTGYTGSIAIPDSSWPASFGPTENYNVYKVIKATTQADSNSYSGGYPQVIPGTWLFQFRLRATADIEPGTDARIWTDSRWFRSPANTSVDGYFAKCLPGQLSSSGNTTTYNFDFDFSEADVILPLPVEASSTITFDSAGGTSIAPLTGNEGDPVPPTGNPTKAGFNFIGWSPVLPSAFPSSDLTVTAQWEADDTIIFKAADVVGTVGNDVVISINITPNSVLAYGTFLLKYDTSKLAYKSRSFGPAQGELNGFNANYATNGDLRTIYYSPVHTEGITAGGAMVNITFTILAGWVGTSILELVASEVVDPIYNSLSYITQNGSVTVGAQVQTVITFETAGGSYVEPVSGEFGSPVTAPADPVLQGYTFVGWNPALPTTFPAEDLYVEAQWEEILPMTYEITFDANGGLGGEVQTVLEGDMPYEPTVERAGYEFIGWIPEIVLATADATYTAVWEEIPPATYEVIFDANGGIGDSYQMVNEGEMPILPADPTREGYVFLGWEPEIVPAYDNACYMAIWYQIIVTIEFYTWAGSYIAPISGEVGSPVTAPADPVLQGYTFVGWNPALPATFPAEDLYVEAQWIPIEYQITFDANGGVGGEVQTVLEGETPYAPEVYREGYTFTGWIPEVVPATADATYTAVWEEIPPVIYEVFFDANGGIGDSYQMVNEGEMPILPADPTREGYVFLGWDSEIVPAYDNACYMAIWYQIIVTIEFYTWAGSYIAPISGEVGSPVTAPADPVLQGYTFVGWNPALPATYPAEDLYVEAQWIPIEYQITFDANGGAGGYVQTVLEGDMPDEPYVERNGYIFIGWTPEVVPATADATYTAQWEVIHDLVYTINNGEVTITGYTGSGGALIIPDTIEGYPVTSIGDWAFADCGLTSITIPDSVTSIGVYAFMGCVSLTSITIPDSVMTIGDYAFHMSGLTSITIPDSVTSIGYGAFSQCPSMTSFNINENNPIYFSFDGVLFDKNQINLIKYPEGKIGHYAIPDSVTSIGDEAFSWCNGLTSISIPDSVTSIGNWAFLYCGITSITIPDSVTSIGDYAFYECSVTIYGNSGSYAQTYANNNGIPFVSTSTYQITFDANGGIGGGTQVVNEGEMPILPADPTREGYIFLGWDSEIVPAYDHACYTAVWEEIFYEVIFDANGGIGGSYQVVNEGEMPIVPADPTREGYIFLGWDSEIIPAYDHAYYMAIWQQIIVTIEFDTAGGSEIEPISGYYGDSVWMPMQPTRIGYTFAGWYPAVPGAFPAEDLTVTAMWQSNVNFAVFVVDGYVYTEIPTEYNSIIQIPPDPQKPGYVFEGWDNIPEMMPDDNVYINATWSIGQYTITFDANGGTGSSEPVTQEFGTEVVLPATGFEKTGHTFVGWGYYPQEQYYNAITGTMQMPPYDSTLYAIYSINYYTVTFVPNNGWNDIVWNIPYGAEIQPPEVQKPGYTFTGWTPEVPATMPAEDTTYMAQWSINSYTIAFDANGGTGSCEPVTQEYETEVILPATGFEKTGYTFVGWGYYPEAQYYNAISGSMPMPSCDSTLYAIYSVNYYTVTFVLNNGGSDTVWNIPYGCEIYPPDVQRPGYTFMGWTPEVSATMPAENTTYTAQWSINSYTITFDSNGGTGSSEPVTQEFETEVALPAAGFEKFGYTFVGWGYYPEMQYYNAITGSVPMPSCDSTLYAIYSVNQYTATFVLNNGWNDIQWNIPYGYEVYPPEVQKPGYTFMGWMPEVPETMPAEDTTYTAQWSINSYTITFDANGGTGSSEPITQEFGTEVALPTTGFEKTGHTFVGWAYSPNPYYSWEIYNSTIQMPDGDTTLYAIYSINYYTVTFVPENGWSDIVWDIPFGYEIYPPEVQKPGYTFTGWTPEVPATMPAEDATYTAQWSINSYTITFDANGGTGSSEPVTQEFGTEVALPTTGFEKLGHTFVGWGYYPQEQYYNAITGIMQMPGYDTTLYAIYRVNTYVITFDPNDGMNDVMTAYMEYGMQIYAPQFGRPGYTFTGWTPELPETVGLGDTTYTAQWSINSYTMIFDANGGTGSSEPVTQEFGTEVALPTTGFEKLGHTFVGWGYYPQEQYYNAITGTMQMPPYDSTLYAIYRVNTYVITFDPNDGMSGVMTAYMEYGMQMYAPQFGRPGYTFTGWTPELPETVGLGDTSYTAQWSINSYTMTFDANGGTGSSEPVTQEFGTEVALPTTGFEKTGHTFVGWAYSPNPYYSWEIYNTTIQMPDGDTTLYAIHNINHYTVTFVPENGWSDIVWDIPFGYEIYPPEVQKPGYTFTGWTPEVPAIMPSGNMTFTAQWVLALAAPESLISTAITDSTVNLEWPSVPNADSYNVYCDGVKITQTPITSLSYLAEGLLPQTQYVFTVTAVSFSEESTHSPVCVVVTDFSIAPQAVLTVGNRIGLPDKYVTIPVTVSPSAGIGAAWLRLNFDPNVLDYIEITSGPAFPGTLSVNANNQQNGVVIISYMTMNPDVSGGTIMDIKFKVKEAAQYQNSNISLEVLELTDFDCNDLTYSIVQGAVKVGVLGDINGDGVIRAVDALMALQAASGRYVLDADEMLIADVNGSGTVSSVDALRILQYSAGRITSF